MVRDRGLSPGGQVWSEQAVVGANLAIITVIRVRVTGLLGLGLGLGLGFLRFLPLSRVGLGSFSPLSFSVGLPIGSAPHPAAEIKTA